MKTRVFFGFLLNLLSFLASASGNFSVFEELIYWHVSQQTSSLWVTSQPLNTPPGYTYPVHSVNFGWSPGLKLGMKYEPQDSVDFKLYWTYFSTKTTDSVTAPPGHVLFPVFFNGFTTLNFFNQAQLKWQMRMNTLDGEIGHEFSPLDTLKVRPFIGVKGGVINQNLDSSWQARVGNFNAYTATENVVQDFWGIGPSFGVDSVWNLYKDLKINSSLATALLWGHWNIQDTYSRPEALLGLIAPTTISSNIKNSMLGSYMVKLFLGLEWRFKARTLVTMKAGYEMQFWANQLRLPLYEQLPVRGDLTLQGITCGISIGL